MAAKKPETKAKAKPYSVSGMYQVKGDELTRKNKQCPKCGAGVFMAPHKNRAACGKCGYTEKAE
jgi:small subunit ribosomal protein S27Ae